MIDAVRLYLQRSIEELRHVRWPTQKQAFRLSFIVLGFTAASALFFGFADFLLSQLMKILLSFSA